jgi:hypothetical protein
VNDARQTILLNYPETGDPGTLNHLLDLYAHQLASQIRTLRDGCRYEPDSPEYKHMTGAADYIDPLLTRLGR